MRARAWPDRQGQFTWLPARTAAGGVRGAGRSASADPALRSYGWSCMMRS